MKSHLQKLLSPTALVVITYALCAVVWGTGWFAIRLSTGIDGYPVLGGSALRYTTAALVLAMILSFCPRAMGRLHKSQLFWLLVAGAFNAGAMGLLCWGERTVSGGLASVLVATSPLIVAIMVLITRTEPVRLGSLLGSSVALVGIAVIFGERLTVSPTHLCAMGAVLGAAVLFSLVNLIMKLKVGEVKSIQSSVIFFGAMSAILWLACPTEAAPMPWPPPVVPTCALAYLSLACSALAFPAFCYLLRHASLMCVSSLALVHPVIALITDCFFEHTFVLTASAYIGITIVLAGLLLSMFLTHRPRLLRTEPAA